MNILDIIILIPILYGMVRGFFKGLVGEITSLVAIILGIVGAKLWANEVSHKLLQLFEMNEQVAQCLSYVLIFITIAITLNLLGKIIEKFLNSIALGGINKLLGTLFGGIKLLLIVSVILNGVALLEKNIPFIKIKPETKAASACYQPTLKCSSVAWNSFKKAK